MGAFNPEPNKGCPLCKGAGELPSFRFNVPCECVEPYWGWVWDNPNSTSWYWNLKGQEIEVACVSRQKDARIPSGAVCVGRLCHWSRVGKRDGGMREKEIERFMEE